MEIYDVRADFWYVPNLPRCFAWLYFNRAMLVWANRCLSVVIHKFFRMRDAGASMVVTFRKEK